MILLIIGLILSIGFSSTVEGCPTGCICKWRGGKQTVSCSNMSLRTFPGPIDPGTQVLDLGGNSFETLPSDHFMRLNLINLQKIYLAKCKINSINSKAFRGLSNLVDLDLSLNALREIPTQIFSDCVGLMRLVLSGNPITQIQTKAFIGLQSLTTLELSQCGIEIIDKGGFEGLDSLEWLKLDGNKLRRLDGLQLLPSTLRGIWLDENPWECDCKLLELRSWIEGANLGNSHEPKCYSPQRLVNSTIKELQIQDFACPPQLSPTTMYQKIGEGKNVSLLCKVTSSPESTLEWWFNNQPLNSNFSLNILIETSSTYHHESTQKKSELLILNATSEENGTFLCLAKNPAGVAYANFTLRVLSPIDTDSYSENVNSFVGAYPNLFLIVLSALAVVALVVLLMCMTFIFCKCTRFFTGRGRSTSAHHLDSRHKLEVGGGIKNKEVNKSGSGGSLTGGSKMERHLSDTSTMTTHTKSNGSVFLLSTSSELGDSNPDLIEGVKRVEADGHEGILCHHMSSDQYVRNCSGTMSSSAHALGIPSTTTKTLVEPYPMEYGLPSKGLNVSTLVRSSPVYGGTLPPSYDLAKYPKEYINPIPLTTQNGYIYAYTGGPTPEIYTTQQPMYNYIQHGPGGGYSVYGGGEYVGYSQNPSSASCSCILEETEEVEDEKKNISKVDRDPLKVKSRLQRSLTTTINESPDEGYEDEGGEV